jgi:rhodanese-related sulfurtransferase/CBS domain-containing protein
MSTRLDRDQVRRLVKGGAVLVEVLPPSAYEDEHLAGAINIPVEDLAQQAPQYLSREQPVIVYCYDSQCDLSARAASRFESLGYSHVYRYAAGKMDWLAFDQPCEGSSTKQRVVRNLMRRDVPTCNLTERLSSVRLRLTGSAWEFCVVVDGGRVVHGLLPLAQSSIDDEAWHIMQESVRSFRPYAEAEQVLESMRTEGFDRAVITNSDGQLLGALLRADAERATMNYGDD